MRALVLTTLSTGLPTRSLQHQPDILFIELHLDSHIREETDIYEISLKPIQPI